MYILLFIIGILLIIVNTRAIKREKNSFEFSLKEANINLDEVDIKFTQLRREFAETITELQGEILELKEIIEEMKNNNTSNYDTTVLLKEISKIDKKLNKNVEVLQESNEINSKVDYENNASIDKIKEEYSEELNYRNQASEEVNRVENNSVYTEGNIIKDENKICEEEKSSNNLKVEDVKTLFQQGLTVEEVAAKLNIGKGEVLLIKELYLR